MNSLIFPQCLMYSKQNIREYFVFDVLLENEFEFVANQFTIHFILCGGVNPGYHKIDIFLKEKKSNTLNISSKMSMNT